MHALGRANRVGMGVFQTQPAEVWQRLVCRVDGALQRLGRPAFVRLGSRSPKDTAAFTLAAGCALSGAQALALLTAGSHRVAYDLRWCLRSGWLPSIFLREWHEIALQQEWRGFLFGGRVVACRPCLPQQLIAPEVVAEMHRLGQQVLTACGQQPLVFDAYLPEPAGPARLIEVNPWGPPTDSLGLNWDDLQTTSGAG